MRLSSLSLSPSLSLLGVEKMEFSEGRADTLLRENFFPGIMAGCAGVIVVSSY